MIGNHIENGFRTHVIDVYMRTRNNVLVDFFQFFIPLILQIVPHSECKISTLKSMHHKKGTIFYANRPKFYANRPKTAFLCIIFAGDMSVQ